MAKSSRHSAAGVSQLEIVGDRRYWHLLAQLPRAVELSAQARARLEMIEWHYGHGRCVALTARHFGWRRPTVYRWLARFEPSDMTSLEDRSSRPNRRRRPTWTRAQIAALRELRGRYPRWGKVKLAVLARRRGVAISDTTAGRILGYLRARGEIREPIGCRISARRRVNRRHHAVRKPAAYTPRAPGDLVEIDTLDVRPVPDKRLKQFTARDVVSRWDVLELRRSATAKNAASMLDALAARMPFAVRAISIDGGSEFKAEFETACAERGIALYLLPPRSPKLHGAVERANRTHTEEFYEVTDVEPELEALAAALADWEVCYNTVRPHQALGYLTPAEWLAKSGYSSPSV